MNNVWVISSLLLFFGSVCNMWPQRLSCRPAYCQAESYLYSFYWKEFTHGKLSAPQKWVQFSCDYESHVAFGSRRRERFLWWQDERRCQKPHCMESLSERTCMCSVVFCSVFRWPFLAKEFLYLSTSWGPEMESNRSRRNNRRLPDWVQTLRLNLNSGMFRSYIEFKGWDIGECTQFDEFVKARRGL